MINKTVATASVILSLCVISASSNDLEEKQLHRSPPLQSSIERSAPQEYMGSIGFRPYRPLRTLLPGLGTPFYQNDTVHFFTPEELRARKNSTSPREDKKED